MQDSLILQSFNAYWISFIRWCKTVGFHSRLMYIVDARWSNFIVRLTWVGNFWNWLHYIPTKLKVTKTKKLHHQTINATCTSIQSSKLSFIFKVSRALRCSVVGLESYSWSLVPWNSWRLTFNFNNLLFAPVKFPLFFGHEPTILCMFMMFLEDGRFSEWDREGWLWMMVCGVAFTVYVPNFSN